MSELTPQGHFTSCLTYEENWLAAIGTTGMIMIYPRGPLTLEAVKAACKAQYPDLDLLFGEHGQPIYIQRRELHPQTIREAAYRAEFEARRAARRAAREAAENNNTTPE